MKYPGTAFIALVLCLVCAGPAYAEKAPDSAKHGRASSEIIPRSPDAITCGAANTASLSTLDAGTGTGGTQPYQAAVHCHGLSTDGYSDWYLPAQNEAANIVNNATALNINASLSAKWATSTDSTNAALGGDATLNPLGESTANKNYTYVVRCVRKSTTDPGMPALSGLAGWWKLDDGSGSSAADSSGNGYAAALTGSPTWTTSSRLGPYALTLNGSSQYATIPAAVLPSANNFTLSLWLNTTSDGVLMTEQNAALGGTPTSYDPFLYIETNGKLHAGIFVGSAPTIQTSSAVNDGNWHNAVLVVNITATTQTLYVDGSLVGSFSGTPEGPWSDVYMGTGYTTSSSTGAPATSGSFYFNGTIDEVRIYNNALTSGQTSEIYQSGLPPTTAADSAGSATGAGEQPDLGHRRNQRRPDLQRHQPVCGEPSESDGHRSRNVQRMALSHGARQRIFFWEGYGGGTECTILGYGSHNFGCSNDTFGTAAPTNAVISGGGGGEGTPSLSITKTHSGNFTQEQQGATYAVTVSNTSGAGATSGLVTVTDTIPSGLTLASMAGTGWTCTTSTCMRSDALNGGSSYPAITVTVNVASNASSPQVNQVSVAGGGSSQANATDSTTITAAGSGAGVYYYLQDQIGSTRVIAEIPQGQNTATLCYDADFHPYGGELPVVDNCPADFEFVGKERDPESNLDNSQARFYSNQWGRFMSPDPGNAGADPGNPQNWNMYSYVLNNPLGLVDPSGLDTCQGWSDVNGSTDESPQGKDSCAAAGGTWIPTLNQTITVNGGPDNSSSPSDSNYSVDLSWYTPDTLAPPQAPVQNACSTGSPNNHLLMGDQVDAASVNPFTSRGGGIWGGNRQSFPATTNNYTYNGKGLGLDFGVCVQSAWAWGSGSWSGTFHSVNWSIGVFSGSMFWTPGKGGWTGLSFGLGLGLPGVAYEQTNYTCKSGPG